MYLRYLNLLLFTFYPCTRPNIFTNVHLTTPYAYTDLVIKRAVQNTLTFCVTLPLISAPASTQSLLPRLSPGFVLLFTEGRLTTSDDAMTTQHRPTIGCLSEKQPLTTSTSDDE